MEECLICYSKPEKMKQLACNHSLCNSCYLHLDTQECPFCRQKFSYTKTESLKRRNLNINYSNWQPPQELLFPNSFTNYRRTRVRRNRVYNPINNRTIIDNLEVTGAPFSRLNKNRKRNKRKNLTLEQILEKRKQIRKKCKKKWETKNKRLRKMWWIS